MRSAVHKLLSLLTRRERRRLWGLLAATLVLALLQVAGIASIMPFLALVSNPDMVQENALMQRVYVALGFGSTESFLIFAGIAVVVLLTVGNAFFALINWLEARFVWTTNHRISSDLLLAYLNESYLTHVNRNAAGLSANILAEVQSVVGGLLRPALYVVTRSVVALMIFGLLALVDITLAVTIGVVLGGSYTLIYVWARRKLDLMGTDRLQANSQRYKIASEALGGFKETKVLGREHEFVRRYRHSSDLYTRRMTHMTVLKEVPRYAMESIAFGGLIVIILYLLARQQNIQHILPILSLYAVAGYKLMPALQAIFSNLTTARFNLAALDVLYSDLFNHALIERPAQELAGNGVTLKFEHVIALDRGSFTYPGADSAAVRNVSLKIQKNSTVAFVGATGCGKTTTVDVLAGLLVPQEGALLVDGAAISSEESRKAWRSRLGYIPQRIYLCDDSIKRNIAFGLPDNQIDLEAVRSAAQLANLHDFIAGLPAGYDTIVGDQGVRLSGGQRQRIGIARALYHDPDVLIMDEATNSLDGITEQSVMMALSALGHKKTIILIAHRLATVRECDRIFLMEDGDVTADGTFDELVQCNTAFREMAAIGGVGSEEEGVV